ncbi:MAG: HEAT repeat domain-containing protein [Planctomycetota bacterium]|jgi:HEAT repeat protein
MRGRRILAVLGVVAALLVPVGVWRLAVRGAVGRELAGLGHPDAARREATAERLAAMGPQVVPLLIEGFAASRGGGGPRDTSGPDATLPVTAPLMNLLRGLEDPELIGHLIAAMRDRDEDVRHYAGLTLAYIGQDAVQPLVETLREAPDVRSRTSAAWALSFMGAVGQEAVPALRAVLADEHEHKDVRYTARYALEQLTDEGGALWQAVDRVREEQPR